MQKLKAFLSRFSYAINGIRLAYLQERNIRIQSAAAVIILASALAIGFDITDFVLLIFICGLVLTLELVNTAIERAVDLSSVSRHPLAKAAKDIAAGAVLLASVLSVPAGILLFVKYLFL